MTALPQDDGALALAVADLPNGVSLHYERQKPTRPAASPGTEVALIFIHGVMGDWRSWDPQWDHFTPDHECVRYSRRYNYPNRNSLPSPHHSALHEAEDLSLFIDHLGLARAILVGSSYGSFTALALAVQQPQRCAALALSEPPMMRYADLSEAGRQAKAAFYAQSIEPANAAFRAGRDDEGARIMTQGINGAAAPVLTPAAMQRRLQNVQAMKTLALSTDEFPWLSPEQLARLPMPILLMAGQRTPAIHAEIFRNVCQAMPQAEIQWINDAGHGTSRDNPVRFNEVVSSFLEAHGFRANQEIG